MGSRTTSEQRKRERENRRQRLAVDPVYREAHRKKCQKRNARHRAKMKALGKRRNKVETQRASNRRYYEQNREKKNWVAKQSRKRSRQNLRLLRFLSNMENVMATTAELMAPVKTIDEVRAEVAELTNPELHAAFERGLRLSKSHLLRLGVIVVELEKRHEKVNGQPGLLRLLRGVGNGTILPDIVIKFAGRPLAMQKLAALPVKDQAATLEMTEQEVDKLTRNIPKGKGSLLGRAGGNGPNSTSAKRIVAEKTVDEVMDLCMDLISNHRDSVTLAKRMIDHLKEYVAAHEPPAPKVHRDGKPSKNGTVTAGLSDA